MREVAKILNQIANTSSRNDKETILQKHKDNKLLKDILQFVYDPFIVTGLSSKKINKDTMLYGDDYKFETVNDVITYLKHNNTGRDIDIARVHNFIYKHDNQLQELYKQIFTKELKIGVTAKTLNKVFGKGFINEFNVMLAEKYFECEDKVTGEFIITTKLDGIRCVIVRENGTIKMFSRQGQVIEGLIEIEEEANKLPDNIVYDGELILINKNNLNSADLYRETVKVVRKDGIKKNVVFHVFDMVGLGGFKKGIDHTPCSMRKKILSDTLNQHCFEFIKEVKPLYVGKDKNKILELLNEATANGQEGVMVNISLSPYECKRTKNILKVKKFNDADVLVIGLIEGTGQNEGKLGAITIQFLHEGKKWECNCGSGFSQEERELYWLRPELIIGKIVTIGYFEVSSNKQGTFGLRFPTWKSIVREDKTEISMY